MEARLIRLTILVTALTGLGASHRTENFVVTAPTPQLAQQIGEAAEQYRKALAVEWLGEEMRPWSRPCPITANVAPNLGAGGATSFVFQNGEVFGWEMTIQGSEERILDSVLPHEVTHTIFATHFRQPLPRWADEGACTTVEHPSEKMRHQQLLIQFLKTGRGIAMSRMFAMKEYPQDVLPLYAQGFSVARYMIQHGGKRKFVAFMEDGLESGDWRSATQAHYGHSDLATLQKNWLNWVRAGSPQINPNATPTGPAIAAAGRPRRATPTTFAPASSPRAEPNAVAAASAQIPVSPNARAAAPTSRPVNWEAAPDKPAATPPVARKAQPPQRYQAVRQQPPQRPKQRVLR